jgi:single-stranded-DNA-specific exonuclease
VLTAADLEPTIEVDAALAFADISAALVRMIEQLEPFGVGNPRPVFGTRNARMLQPMKILKDKHAKLRLRDSETGRPYDGMAWRMRETVEALGLAAGDLLDITYTLEENTDPEFGGIQLVLKQVARAHAAAAV